MQKLNKKSLANAVLALTLWLVTAHSQSAPLEYQVKASYLYNFIQFITWPNDVFGDDGKFNVCVLGAERFGGALDAFVGERIEGHEIALRRLEQPTPAQTAHCHMLFISSGEITSAETTSKHGLLVIGESPGFLERGGAINLVEVNGRIRFEINQHTAQRAGLVVSSRILSLAINKP